VETRLIVGLGNPGKKYEKTRHNIGYLVVDKLAQNHSARFRSESKFFGQIAEWQSQGQKWIALKPETFMNASGKSVAPVLQFYKISVSAILVIIDDVEIPLSMLRLRVSGGSGGHNGLHSIMEVLASKEFARLRIGVGRPTLPVDLADWVLQPFQKSELPFVEESLNKAVCAVESWAIEGPATAMNRFNATRQPSKEDPPTTAA
jgi:peptidyl-tRNA hydrolase, PTH1 family